MRRVRAVTVVLVVGALLVAGCSGDGGGEAGGGEDGGEASASSTVTTVATSAPPEAATEAFVGSACTALATLAAQAQVLGQTVAGDDLGAITQAYARTTEVADGLVSQVATVPPPGVDGGDTIKAAVLAAYEAAAVAVESAESAFLSASTVGGAAGVDEPTLAVAEQGVATVNGAVDGLRSMLNGLRADFPDASAALGEALEHEHDCEGLATE